MTAVLPDAEALPVLASSTNAEEIEAVKPEAPAEPTEPVITTSPPDDISAAKPLAVAVPGTAKIDAAPDKLA